MTHQAGVRVGKTWQDPLETSEARGKRYTTLTPFRFLLQMLRGK